MKLNIETVLPVLLALLILADLAFHGVTELTAAPLAEQNINLQKPRLDPELVHKTNQDTDKVAQHGQL